LKSAHTGDRDERRSVIADIQVHRTGGDIMRRIAILALTTLALAACGPDDHESFSATQAAANPALPASAIEPLVQAAPSGELAASSAIAAAQTSLAADTQQVAPVMHSPPDTTQ
jgi:hypothetical protein